MPENSNVNHNFPLVSCVIACYRKFDYLYDAIKSVLEQDYPRIELFITDDCSPDFPHEQITDYIQKHKKENLERFVVNHNEQNLGTVKNMNNMLKISKGDYIINLDGDDMFYDTTIMSKIVRRFQETGCDFMSCARQACNHNMEPLYLLPTPEELKEIAKLDTPQKQFSSFALSKFYDIASGSCMYYSRDHINRFGYYDETYRLWEDGPYITKYAQAGYMILQAYDIISIKYRTDGISNVAPGSSPAKILLGKDHLLYIEKVLIPNKRNIKSPYKSETLFWYYWDKDVSAKGHAYAMIRYPSQALKIIYRKLRGKKIR